MNKAHGLITDLLKTLAVKIDGFGENDGSYDPVEALMRSVRSRLNGVPEGTEFEEDAVCEYRNLLTNLVNDYIERRSTYKGAGSDVYSDVALRNDYVVDLVAIGLSVLLTNGTDLLNDREQFDLFASGR